MSNINNSDDNLTISATANTEKMVAEDTRDSFQDSQDSQTSLDEVSSSENDDSLTLEEKVEIIKEWMKNHQTLPVVIGRLNCLFKHIEHV